MEDIYQNILLPVDGSQNRLMHLNKESNRQNYGVVEVFLVHVLPKDDKAYILKNKTHF